MLEDGREVKEGSKYRKAKEVKTKIVTEEYVPPTHPPTHPPLSEWVEKIEEEKAVRMRCCTSLVQVD